MRAPVLLRFVWIYSGFPVREKRRSYRSNFPPNGIYSHSWDAHNASARVVIVKYTRHTFHLSTKADYTRRANIFISWNEINQCHLVTWKWKQWNIISCIFPSHLRFNAKCTLLANLDLSSCFAYFIMTKFFKYFFNTQTRVMDTN